MMKWMWALLGWMSLVTGVIGIFLPVLPTTPFVILAAYCFSKSSRRMHEWLTSHKTFGPIIQDWNTHRSIPARIKALASVMIVLGLSTTWMIPGLSQAPKLAATVFCAIGMGYVITRPTRPKL